MQKKILIIMFLILIPMVFSIPQNIDLQLYLTDTSNNPKSISDNINVSINEQDGTQLYSTKQSITFENGLGHITLSGVDLSFNETDTFNISGDTVGYMGSFNYSSIPTAYRAKIADNVSSESITNDSILSDSDYSFGNLTIGQKLVLGLGLIIDNLITNWLRITGNLNVTENITASNILAFINSSYIQNPYWININGDSSTTPANFNLPNSNLTINKINTSGDAYFGGNVGIGTTNPTEKLVVVGNVNITGNATIGTDMLFIDSTNHRIGINTTSPSAILDINLPSGSGVHSLKINSGSGYELYFAGSSANMYSERSMVWLAGSGNDIAFGSNNKNYQLELRAGTGNRTLMIYEDKVGISSETGIWIPSHRLNVRGSVNITENVYIFGNVGIGTETPSYPLHVKSNTSGISIYAEANMSATGFIERTSSFDSSKNPFDYILDSNNYLDKGKIDHSKFYGYTKYNKTDYSRPVYRTELQCNDIQVYEVCDYQLNKGFYDKVCFNSTTNTTGEPLENCIAYNISECRFEKVEDKDYFEKVCENIENQNCTSVTENVCGNVTITDYPYQKTEEGVSLGNEVALLRQAVYDLKNKICQYHPTDEICLAKP